jgi:hypothetical protein
VNDVEEEINYKIEEMINHIQYTKSERNLETRIHVLRCSIAIENLVSEFIIKLLGVYDKDKALALGNRSTEISFDAKIHLLHDLGYLTPDELNKIVKPVMRIRNKFLHSLDADTFITASNNEMKKELYPNYKNSSPENLESDLQSGYNTRVEQTLKIVESKISEVETSRKERYELVFAFAGHATDLLNHYRHSVREVEDILNNMLAAEEITIQVRNKIANFVINKYNSYLETQGYEEYRKLIMDDSVFTKMRDIVVNKI